MNIPVVDIGILHIPLYGYRENKKNEESVRLRQGRVMSVSVIRGDLATFLYG